MTTRHAPSAPTGSPRRGLRLLALLLSGAALGLGCAVQDTPATPTGPEVRVVGTAASQPAAPTTPAAEKEPPAQDVASAIPFDPAVRRGTLENGLQFYVRRNVKPEKRAELRLVVNAGSILEDDDQRGLAHFVEHMAFNGTKNFEKQELVEYLERIGMRFGPDINAYTSFDETVYMLQIPTDDEEIVSTAFQILEDWAHNVEFEDEEIDKERGVVVEEWRLRRGAQGRIQDKQFPVMFHGSRYAERLPIGKKETLEGAPYEALKRFYRDWYRPSLMAVVAVGDFDEDQIEARIRNHFSKLKDPEEPRERPSFEIPDHEETLFSIVQDPEATNIRVTVGYKREPVPDRTLEDFRSSLIDNVYDGLIMQRLGELGQQADPPFQFGFASSGSLGRSKAIYQLFAAVRDGGVERGLETLLTEAKRAEEHGFNESELERAKVSILRSVERLYEERDKQESGRFARGYVQHFLEGDSQPSVEFIRDIVEDVVPGITLDEVNARAGQWITDDNRVIMVSGPETDAAGIPDEGGLLAVFEGAEKIAVDPWVDQTRDAPLVAQQPTAGRVTETATVPEIGMTRWTSFERGSRPAQEHRLQERRDPAARHQPRWSQPGRQRGLHHRSAGVVDRGRDGPRRVLQHRARQGAHREGGPGPRVHRRADRRRDGFCVPQGSGDHDAARASAVRGAAP